MEKRIMSASIMAVILASICAVPNAFGQTYILYKDPGGKYSIKYPSDWLSGYQTGPGGNGSMFSSPNDVFMRVDVGISKVNFSNPDPATFLTMTGVNTTGNNYTITQPLNCDTYTLAGHRACTTTYQGQDSNGAHLQTISLVSIINGTSYGFGLTDTQANFNRTLPTFMYMLLTFKLRTQ